MNEIKPKIESQSSDRVKRLYEIPRDSGIKIRVLTTDNKEKDIEFKHIDGMYSYLTDEEGNVYHLSASTPLELIKDKLYRIT